MLPNFIYCEIIETHLYKKYTGNVNKQNMIMTVHLAKQKKIETANGKAAHAQASTISANA
jgi:hypothetical protein